MTQAILNRSISYYKNSYQTDSEIDVTVQEFLDWIAIGKWKDHVLKVRAAHADKNLYDKLKKEGPSVTISGTFNKRNAQSLREASGLMAIDLDKLESDQLLKTFNRLKTDPFVYAVFRSTGGNGLCVLFKVDINRWLEAFEGIRIYFAETYGLIVAFDKSVKDISRLRFVSYDPDLFVNSKAQSWRQYVKKDVKSKPDPDKFWYRGTDKDIEYVIQQIESRRLDITQGDGKWVVIGLAFINEFGEVGRHLFHRVCQFHPEYQSDEVDKKWDYWTKANQHKVTIATFYYHCKQSGIDIMTSWTKEVVSVAAMAKKQKITKESALDQVLKMTDATEKEAQPLIDQVYAAEGIVDTQETLFDKIELFLQVNYPMRRNLITRHIETMDGKPYHEEEFNDIYRALRKSVDDKIKYVDMERIILSSFTPTYNPFSEFFINNRHRTGEGFIRQLVETVETNTGFEESNFAPDFAYYFVRKWLLGIIESMHAGHSPLCLVFAGGINIGKTEWFRRLLPDELLHYFGESKLDKGKDDEILMCKKLILFNDEFGGMTKGDVKHFKNLTSKQVFNLREPFGRSHVDLRRIAVLCGSSNEHDLLNDPTGNRRIIPLHTTRFDWKAYNAIDKADLLMEAFHAYQAGERHHLTMEDIALLSDNTKAFEDICVERELIQKYYSVPEDKRGAGTMFLSNTEIKVFLEKVSQQRIGIKRLSQEMIKLGFICEVRKVRNQAKRGYSVISETEHANIDAAQ